MAKKANKDNSNSFVVHMKEERPTKNTIKFEQDYDPTKEAAILQTIYLPKHVVGESKRLKVTVEML